MERIPVQSSNLASVGFDAESLTLEIEFNHGGIYQYFGVSQDIYDGLINASSKGNYFHQNIKLGGFAFHKVG